MFHIDEDITRARALPADAYRDPALLSHMRERIFARSWQVVGEMIEPGRAEPCTFLQGCIDEPLVLTREPGGQLHCLSNVCTHRGNLLCAEPGPANGLRCGYHGRRFRLDGRFVSMPEFDGVRDFPSAEDDLPRLPTGALGPLVFAALDPFAPLDALLAPIRARLGWLPLDALRPDPAAARDYELPAHFALYCDNYLEGFHIPFVHPALARAIDYGSYTVELFDWVSLQLGEAAPGEDAFEPPPGSADQGRRVAAYYFFVFPNLMLNFYPWGLSLNVVRPLSVDRTEVAFRAFLLDPSRRGRGAGAALDRVELEDEAIVAQVQRGMGSRLYRRGRYSPSRERAVHHFHRLLERMLAD